jgi:hypothetical protein
MQDAIRTRQNGEKGQEYISGRGLFHSNGLFCCRENCTLRAKRVFLPLWIVSESSQDLHNSGVSFSFVIIGRASVAPKLFRATA